ncbi:MAG TPA: ATP-binding cassette domain-containing protein [Spirochaetia bacterium]|nr:ATP-binding cassette domain-containing protein [Spirochaetia bacterium]
MIDLERVGKRYGAFEAVHDVSFSVGGHEIVGLLGPNGAGKTTIMKILTCFHFPTAGSVTVNGFDIYQDALSIKRSIGYLPENAPVYADLTVLEYLDFIAEVRYPGSGRAGGETARIRRERLDWAILECGLGPVANRSISKLSKGFRQRTGLAQAILHDPAILILDEPTSGLDPNQIIEIRRLIRKLGREKTVILSTHILQEVEAVCDRVLILNEGKIVAEGTTEEIGRGMRGEDVFVLELKFAGSSPTESALMGIPGVSRVARFELESDGQRLQAHLSMTQSAGNAEAIFDWAVSGGYKILSMTRQRVSLEDIFTSLTSGGGAGRE